MAHLARRAYFSKAVLQMNDLNFTGLSILLCPFLNQNIHRLHVQLPTWSLYEGIYPKLWNYLFDMLCEKFAILLQSRHHRWHNQKKSPSHYQAMHHNFQIRYISKSFDSRVGDHVNCEGVRQKLDIFEALLKDWNPIAKAARTEVIVQLFASNHTTDCKCKQRVVSVLKNLPAEVRVSELEKCRLLIAPARP
jgi:hypothetical protein